MIISKTFSSKTKSLLSLTSSNPFSSSISCLILISPFSTSSLTPYTHQFHSQSNADSRNVRVSVWWDFENCHLPSGVNVFRVSQAITSAVRANGMKGPLQITAFGDVMQLSRANQEALSLTGISLNHIPKGGKNSADRSLLIDLMDWVTQNPPPAHLFLISGDRDFANVLHRLRMKNYNILLATTDTAPSVLCSAASIMWHWNSLVKGENLSGRLFNQPPDGPFASWYGHYKVPLEDPFAAVEKSTCSKVEDDSEASSEPTVRPIPKAVMNQICHILSSYPQGIPITELRRELAKSNVVVDKDFYGHKKFSRFLLSMPHILKLNWADDGQFVVRGVSAKAPELFQPGPYKSAPPVVNEESPCVTKSSKSTIEDNSVSGPADEKLLLTSSPKLDLREASSLTEKAVNMHIQRTPEQMEQPLPPRQMKQPSPVAEKLEMVNVLGSEDHLPAVKDQHSASEVPAVKDQHSTAEVPAVEGQHSASEVPAVEGRHSAPEVLVVEKQHSVSEVGFFRKFWKRLFGSKDDDSELKSDDAGVKISSDSFVKKDENALEKCDPCGESPQNKTVKGNVQSPNQSDDPVHPTVQPTFEDKTANSSEPHDDTLRKSPGLFNRLLIWFKLQPNIQDRPLGQHSEVSEQNINRDAGKPAVFSEESFWREMVAFINSKRGSLLISRSNTRSQIAQNLQTGGPLVLRSLNESDALQLVDMLISDKKWIEECPSDAFPFKLTRSASQSAVGDSHVSNGLSSIFFSPQSESGFQKRSGYEGGKKIQNISLAGVSSPVAVEKPSERSRSEILTDCQKLVKEVLEEFPGGYNMGSFRKLFLERYDYNLDVRKLGYPKLASLLQIMPGVQIEDCYMIPSNKAAKCSSMNSTVLNNTIPTSVSSDSEWADASKKDDESDSSWEELGPVENMEPGNEEKESALRLKGMEEMSQKPDHDYESPLSDDELSDSEEASGMATRPGGQAKPRFNDERSSLLEFLDSWKGNIEDHDKKRREKAVGMLDLSTNISQSSDSSRLGTKIETSVENHGLKQRPRKRYSFVEDPANADKTVNSILDSLNKSQGSRMEA